MGMYVAIGTLVAANKMNAVRTAKRVRSRRRSAVAFASSNEFVVVVVEYEEAAGDRRNPSLSCVSESKRVPCYERHATPHAARALINPPEY